MQTYPSARRLSGVKSYFVIEKGILYPKVKTCAHFGISELAGILEYMEYSLNWTITCTVNKGANHRLLDSLLSAGILMFS